MVSGLVTSPEDQDRICFEDASPISIASKLLMSIMGLLLFLRVLRVRRDRVVRHSEIALEHDLVRLVVLGGGHLHFLLVPGGLALLVVRVRHRLPPPPPPGGD